MPVSARIQTGLLAATAAATALLAIPLAAQVQRAPAPVGAWHGNYQLLRDDPRIRTRGGADLLRLQVIQARDEPTAQVSWIAGRAICEGPLAEPCEWIGASGTHQARVIGETLVLALPLSPDAGDPAILVLQRQPVRGQKARLSGVLANARADWGYRFDAIAE